VITPCVIRNETMIEIDSRSPENIADRLQQSLELGSQRLGLDSSKPSRMEDEGYAEEDEGKREEDIPSHLNNHKHQIKVVPSTENSESALPESGFGSDHARGRPMTEVEQDERNHQEKAETSLVNHFEIPVNGANDNENSDFALTGLETNLPAPPPRIVDQERREKQQVESVPQEYGTISTSHTNAYQNSEALAREPESNTEGHPALEEQRADERDKESEITRVDMEVSQANGSSSSPLSIQTREIGPPTERELKKQNDRDGPQLGTSHVDITSHANSSAHSNILPKTLAFDSTSNSNLDQQNTNDDKSEVPKPQTQADGHPTPQPLTKASRLVSVSIPIVEDRGDIGDADPTERDVVDTLNHSTALVENSSGNHPPVQARDRMRSSFPIHATAQDTSRQRTSTPKTKAKWAKVCPCFFGQSDRDQHPETPARAKNKEDIPLTTRKKGPENVVVSIRAPTPARANVPSPVRPPPNPPAPIYPPPRVSEPAPATTAHLAPDRASTPNHISTTSSLYDAPSSYVGTPSQQSLYAKRHARFSPWSGDTTQSGSETDRDPVVIAKENKKVAGLQSSAYNKHTKSYIAHFQKAEREQDATYIAWKDQKKRDKLLEFIQRIIGDSNPENHDMSDRLWYVNYVKVSKNNDDPWESVVLIGCDQENDCRKLNRELEQERNSRSWFLAGYTCRAEIGEGVTLCAVGPAASHSGQDLLGTRIYGHDIKSVLTLCGQSCHIRGPNEVSGSLCTMGGVLNINQDFYVLTSAHPFRQETRNNDRFSDCKYSVCNTPTVSLC